MFQRICLIAWRQHGAFSTAQAEQAGISRSWLSRAASSGQIDRRGRGVYVITGTPRTIRQDIAVDVLRAGADAIATGDTGLGLWCPELDPPQRHVVAVPAASGHRTGRHTRIIRSVDGDLANRGVVDGIPAASVARCLLDASIDHGPDEIVARISACQRHLPLAFGALIEVLDTHARQGRTGITTFRAALRLLTREVPDSEFERLVLRDLERMGVVPPVVHHLVRLPGEDPIELDAAWVARRIDLELDGRDHLTRMRTARRDRQRDRLLLAAGWVVPRFVWDDYLEDRPGMLAYIAALVDGRAD